MAKKPSPTSQRLETRAQPLTWREDKRVFKVCGFMLKQTMSVGHAIDVVDD
jgi:hypothetical protein